MNGGRDVSGKIGTLRDQLRSGKSFTDDSIMDLAPAVADEISEIATTKLRQYFDEIKGLARMAEAGLSDKQIKVKLRLIESRAKYDLGRASKRDRAAFQKLNDFLTTSFDHVRSGKVEERIKQFALFFECVYGYFYYKRAR
ncbi:MAG: type III-A CRISPR-associated protein Csm2 [Deltaproteobacteria bacterium]|nr:MAG: type III-A CRISPR-associated protein Csm2 [Deltaproteobacteria bacterium]